MSLQVHLLSEQPLPSHSPRWSWMSHVGIEGNPTVGIWRWPPYGIVWHVPLSPVGPAHVVRSWLRSAFRLWAAPFPAGGFCSQRPAVSGHPLLGGDPGSPATSVHRHFHQLSARGLSSCGESWVGCSCPFSLYSL